MTLTQTQNYMLNSENYMKHSKNLTRILLEKSGNNIDFTTSIVGKFTGVCSEMIELALRGEMPKESIEKFVDKMTPEWFIEKCKKASQ